MSNLIDNIQIYSQKIMDTLSVLLPGVPPTSIGAGIVWLVRHERSENERRRREEAKERAESERARDTRMDAEARAEGSARAGVDAATDRQTKRLEDEIRRKDLEIEAWKKDCKEGWAGLDRAVLRWTDDNHNSDNNETLLVLTMAHAGMTIPELRKRAKVPDAQTLAGRKGSE
jgi:hypothetical protein